MRSSFECHSLNTGVSDSSMAEFNLPSDNKHPSYRFSLSLYSALIVISCTALEFHGQSKSFKVLHLLRIVWRAVRMVNCIVAKKDHEIDSLKEAWQTEQQVLAIHRCAAECYWERQDF